MANRMATTSIQYIVTDVIPYLSTYLFAPIGVGLAILFAAKASDRRRIKSETITALMSYRGDLASTEFSRALNKITVIFHKDKDIRHQVRQVWEVLNDSSKKAEQTKRAIVGLIYELCQKNGFKGVTEYDIDQAFGETKQTPVPDPSDDNPPLARTPAKKVKRRRRTKKVS